MAESPGLGVLCSLNAQVYPVAYLPGELFVASQLTCYWFLFLLFPLFIP